MTSLRVAASMTLVTHVIAEGRSSRFEIVAGLLRTRKTERTDLCPDAVGLGALLIASAAAPRSFRHMTCGTRGFACQERMLEILLRRRR
jgi:hypothetical protein